MKALLGIIGIIITLLFFSCSDPIRKQLESLDLSMEDCPDSVLKELQLIDTSRIKNPRDRAHFSLLLTQALYKTDIENPDTSKTKDFVYFFRNEKSSIGLRSNFYHSIALEFANSLDSSVFYALRANRISKENKEVLWIARTSDQLADLSAKLSDYQTELIYRKLAAYNYNRVGKRLNADYSKVELAAVFIKNQRPNRGLKILDYLDSQIKYNQRLWTYSQIYRIFGLYKINQNKRALEKINDLDSLGEWDWNPWELALKGSILVRNNEFNKGIHFLNLADSLSSEDNVKGMVLGGWIAYYTLKDNIQKRQEYTDSAIRFQNAYINKVQGNLGFKKTQDFFQMLLLKQKESQEYLEIGYL